jgi:hypothetical protein
MFTLSYEFKNNIPVFHCNICGHCNNFIESTSHINVNRGCCWYFPKYTLMDIKNIINVGKIDFIYSLFKNTKAAISQYFIQVQGFYDKNKYNTYNENNLPISNFDSKLFFKSCPFIGERGCTINFQLRPHPCNLYLCREVIKESGELYKKYSLERKDYYSYCNYFNESLKYELIDNNTDLLQNASKSLNIIEKTDVPTYDPMELNKISS